MVLAVRRNSPCNGRSPISRAMVWDRSPWATAPMTRAVSLVGWTRSPIRVLTEVSASSQEPLTAPTERPLVDLAFLADHPADPLQLVGHPLVELDHLIEGVGHLAGHARPVQRQADREVSLLQGGQGRQQSRRVEALRRVALAVPAYHPPRRREGADDVRILQPDDWAPGPNRRRPAFRATCMCLDLARTHARLHRRRTPCSDLDSCSTNLGESRSPPSNGTR